MNQPDLGLKVVELRQQKGLTQEQLAEQCEVSTRTIQRIESGEVDPRAYTLQCLSKALEFDFGAENTSNENLWLTILHLSSCGLLFIVPLLLWSWKKDKSYKIDQQGRLVLNFQITMTLLMFAGGLFVMVVSMILLINPASYELLGGTTPVILAGLTPLPLILIVFFCFFEGIFNAARSLVDKPIQYPLSIPFVKE
jgi:uncharacterized Tic20 family protein/DNA-binding Xre family transcriptional regulator